MISTIREYKAFEAECLSTVNAIIPMYTQDEN